MSTNHIYLIKRGPRHECHEAPFHPVIVCAKNRIAKWEAGATDECAWVWERFNDSGCWAGFLLVRWRGLDIDYGHLIREVGPMPDGTHTAFFHDEQKEPYTLLNGAVWWDDKPMPAEIAKWGLIYPPDQFSRQSILDSIANDGCFGFEREEPKHWPKLIQDT